MTDSIRICTHLDYRSHVDASNETGTLILQLSSYPIENLFFISPRLAKRIVDALTPFVAVEPSVEHDAHAESESADSEIIDVERVEEHPI